MLENVEHRREAVVGGLADVGHAREGVLDVGPHFRRRLEVGVAVAAVVSDDRSDRRRGGQKREPARKDKPPGRRLAGCRLPRAPEPSPHHLAKVGSRGSGRERGRGRLVRGHLEEVVVEEGKGVGVVLELKAERALNVIDRAGGEVKYVGRALAVGGHRRSLTTDHEGVKGQFPARATRLAVVGEGMERPPVAAPYRGMVGITRRVPIHLSCPCGTLHAVEVVAGVDAEADPELAATLARDDEGGPFQEVLCPMTSQAMRLAVSFVYHDPASRKLALVVPEVLRHREAAERAALWTLLAAEVEADIPAYVRSAPIVFGGGELLAYLGAAPEEGVARPEAARSSWSGSAAVTRPGPVAPPRHAALEPRGPGEGVIANVAESAPPALDGALQRWVQSGQSLRFSVDLARVRFCIAADAEDRPALLAEPLGLLLRLHRLPSYPLISLRLDDGGGRHFELYFDVGDAGHRGPLEALRRRFRFTLDVFSGEGKGLARREVAAPLEENLAYLLAAADDARERIPPADRSFARAVAEGAGVPANEASRHPLAPLFRVADLERLDSPADIVRALDIAERFSGPEGENYLLATRGVSREAWVAARRRVLDAATARGLWMGRSLAEIAVREGIANSTGELAAAMEARFADETARGGHGMASAEVQQNREELRAAAEPSRSSAIDSDDRAVVSGYIGGSRDAPDDGSPDTMEGSEEAGAAESGASPALDAIFRGIAVMNRSDASRALAGVVGHGPSATPFLARGTASRKAFLRQGCALALAAIADEEGVEVLCDLLFAEPTDIWREVARAIGDVGAPALMSLVARIARQPEERHDRGAWALAHLVARGAGSAVEALAEGRDPVAASAARRGLELAPAAAHDRALVREASSPEVTVNRAFSRKFFEALNAAGDDAEVLEESDLLPE